MLDLNLELEKAFKSAPEAYRFAVDHLSKVPSEYREKVLKLLEEVVIKYGNVHYAYWFARDIEEVNKKALEEVVIKSGNVHYAYYFAKDIEGANTKALEEVVIKSDNPYYTYSFARNIKGADKKALQIKFDPSKLPKP